MKLDNLLMKTIGLARFVHTSSVFGGPVSVKKTSLSALRKKTGYTFANCKKALEQFGDDLQKAEAWLRDQAQKEGWAKATKLQNRPAVQGLVGVKVKPEDGLGVLVEVNCETDFVARNSNFQDMIATVADSCFKELDKKAIDGSSYHKWTVTSDLMAKFRWTPGKSLDDLKALTIGQMGENMILRRAALVKTDPRECMIAGYAHSSEGAGSPQGCLIGRYGALVVYRQLPQSSEDSRNSQIKFQDIGRQLCQHIVGLNPQSIGNIEEALASRPETPTPSPLETPPVSEESARKEGEAESEEAVPRSTHHVDNETRLVHQEFLADPNLTVAELLQMNGLEVLDFVRFECGGASAEEK